MEKIIEIQNKIFETEVSPDKARYTAEMVKNELMDYIKIVRDNLGGYGERLLVGTSILFDYLGEVQNGIEEVKRKLLETEKPERIGGA